MKRTLLVLVALAALALPASAERPNPESLMASPQYKAKAYSPVFKKISPEALRDAVKVVSGRSYAVFGYNTPKVQVYMPRIDNSAYAQVRWGEARLTDTKGRPVTYELERGVYSHDRFSDEIRFKSEGEEPPTFARAAGTALLKYPLRVRTLVAKPGMAPVKGLSVKFDGPYVSYTVSGLSVAPDILGNPFPPVRALDATGKQLQRAGYFETSSSNDVDTTTYGYYGKVTRVEIDVVDEWGELEITYDLPPAPMWPKGSEGLTPPGAATVTDTPGGKVEKKLVRKTTDTAPPPAAQAPVTARLGPDEARAELNRQSVQVTDEALWHALMDLDSRKAHLLLEAGVNPNTRRAHINDTPLLFATTMDYSRGEPAQQRAVVDIILDLIAHGADVNASMKETNATPILNAAQYCPAEVVRALIKAGANMKTKAKGGATPLMMAVLMGRTENVKALIEAGYDVAPERESLMPLAAGNLEMQKLLRKPAARKGK